MMTSYAEIWDRIDKCLTALDEVIAAIGEEPIYTKDEYDRDVIDYKLFLEEDDLKKFQESYDELEDLNSDIMRDIIDMYDE